VRRVVQIALLTAALGAMGGCSSTLARPVVLDAAAAESQSPSSREAAQLAPITHAEAEKLRNDADAAQAAGDPSAAQFLAEQAIATYARAAAQARLVRATRALDEAQAPLAVVTSELDKLKEEQQRVAVEVQDLETRIKVAREALPLTASGPADAARSAARREAAQALATEARLLCLSTRLLAPEAAGLKEAEAALQELSKSLEDQRAAPIDAAMRARAHCLESLTSARRKGDAAASTSGDALLSELSRQSLAPVREDRGVVVTLHEPFTGENVARAASEKVEALGRIAAAHPDLPVVLVVHDAQAPRGGDQKRDQKRADALKQLVARHRAARLEVVLAGVSRPVVDPRDKKGRARNERVEVVFVDAGG
jgi:hypothetical protein